MRAKSIAVLAIIAWLVGLLLPLPARGQCTSNGVQWAAAACGRIDREIDDGTWDLYLTGYGWHIDGYTAEHRATLNADSWGGGVGKHHTDANGNEDILFAFVFLDSHGSPEPIAGRARQWYTSSALSGLSVGGGYFAGFTAHNDMLHYVPLPLA
ncbi:antimicrobial peptide resistance and lipid A acylation PagP [Paraburkholderia phosphatilytica]|uniref:antimicrobial peptide resistance and lipid A acylation PagP n=1 Tax=Paraburkholderia phosphatilytica TaxID=2282883 RepID=UPI001F0BCFC7|nr:antimicrobial peptide resistance and lipid A acylation PagP [Paraburkholderia phosphatilytica]